MKEYKLVNLNKSFKWSLKSDLEQTQDAINQQIAQGWELQQITTAGIGYFVGVFFRER